MHALIVANGELDTPSGLDQLVATVDLIIAADGGAEHCRALGIRPAVIIGDMDSLAVASRADYETGGTRILTFPIEKDQTDLELALLHAMKAGATEITVLAALGRRWDQSIANLLLGAHLQFSSQRITFLQGAQRLFAFRAHADLPARVGERVSLIPLAGDAEAVTTAGLKYPLAGETLAFGSSRGVSNVVVAEGASVDLAEGCLLCVISPLEDN